MQQNTMNTKHSTATILLCHLKVSINSTSIPKRRTAGSFGANNCETLLILVMHKSHLPISIRNGSNSLRKKSNTAFNTFRYCLMDSLFDSWAQSTATEQKKMWSSCVFLFVFEARFSWNILRNSQLFPFVREKKMLSKLKKAKTF